MKRKFLLSVICLITLFTFTINVSAEGIYNGSGDSSGGGNSQIGVGSNVGVWHSSTDENVNFAAYKVYVIYSDGNGLSDGNPGYWEYIGHPIVIVGGSGYGDTSRGYFDHRGIFDDYSRSVAGRGAYYHEYLAQQIFSIEKGWGASSTSITNWLNANNDRETKRLLGYMGADKPQKYTKKNFRAKSDGSSYGKPGYRMIVEKLISVSRNTDDTGLYVTTRKNLARAIGEDGTKDSQGFWEVGGPYVHFGEIRTQFNDINVAVSGYSYGDFKSYNRGAGLHIYDPNYLSKFAYYYFVDSACTDCNSSSKNGSYQIQDILDWDAILDSTDSEVANVKNYYKKSNSCGGIYCREEYNVVFPNKNNYVDVNDEKIFNIATGRYFTVNLPTAIVTEGISNFGPIKVTKTRQCRAKSSCSQSTLEKIGIGEFGSVELNYQETKGKKYNVKEKLEKDSTRTKIETNSYSNNTLTMKATQYYVLPKDTYRYSEIGTGEMNKTKPTNPKEYTDLGTSTLPVSFENYNDNKNKGGGTITLSYSLPTNDPNTKISAAFNKLNYFQNPQGTQNIYSKYIKNEMDDKDKNIIGQTACAKMFGYNTSAFKTCANERKTDTTSICKKSMNGNYTCDVNVCKQGEMPGPDGKCCEKGKCNTTTCRVENGKYYDQLGNEITKEEYELQCTCKVLDAGKYIDKNGKLTNNYIEYQKQCPGACKISNGKYYGKYGQEISSKEYSEQCPDGNNCPPEKRSECPENAAMGLDPCYRCPSGSCPMPGGVCPYSGGNVIYRPIDLINPFPGQTGSSSKNRQTGSNWCAYSLTNGTINCSGGNSNSSGNKVVETQIKNNRGVSDYSVYSKSPLYEVDLDTTTIKNIRKYNSSRNYDDWDLECTTSGICHSKFLNGQVSVSGTCSKDSNIATCAER